MPDAIWNGAVIAEAADAAVEIVEGNVYFPMEAVHRQYLKPSDKRTVCPSKGEASCHHASVDGADNPDAAWTCREPLAAAMQIRDGVAFWRGVRAERQGHRNTQRKALVYNRPSRFRTAFERLPVRRLLCLLLLLVLPLQTLAAGGLLPTGNAHGLAHEIDHLKGTHHHHEEDGSIHYDESGESATHLAEHSPSQPSATLPSFHAPQTVVPLYVVAAAPPPHSLPDPVPERPQRPPQVLG